MKKRTALFITACLLIVFAIGLTGCNIIDDLFENASSKDVTITLDPNGGDVSMLTIKGKSGQEMSLPTPTREGYDFAGWYEGYTTIDQTQFPKNDATYTARYYAKQNSAKSTKFISELNKEYSDKTIGLTRDDFDSSAAIDYLVENHNIDLTIRVTVEAYISTIGAGQWLNANGDIVLLGASKSDELATKNIDYYSWITQSLTATTKSSFLYKADSSSVLYFRGSSSYGSTDLVYRNLEIVIEYTEKAGSLV